MALSKIQSESIDLADNFAGMRFGGTASDNALDDYEEGTFTVTTNSDATGAMSSESGEYTKIGNVVHVRIVIVVSTNFTSRSVAGLPFTPTFDTVASGVGGLTPVFTESGGPTNTFARWQNGSTTVQFFSTTDGTGHTPSTSGSFYRLQFAYFV